jgi:hypothetical protein
VSRLEPSKQSLRGLGFSLSETVLSPRGPQWPASGPLGFIEGPGPGVGIKAPGGQESCF